MRLFLSGRSSPKSETSAAIIALLGDDAEFASLAKYEISFSDDESTEELRNKLAQFYADRTLTKSPITPQDQAQGILFMLSDASSKTTGQILAVDGGLQEAFLR